MLRINRIFVLSSIYWIQGKSSSIHLNGKGSMSVSVPSSNTINLLVDFDRGEIRNMKEDERRLERTVFSFEILITRNLG